MSATPDLGDRFAWFATHTSRVTGSHWSFLVAALAVAVSLIVLGIETTNILISVVTLLMVFILQNTQNRDSAALHLKLDEMVRVLPEARDELRGVEAKAQEEIEDVRQRDLLEPEDVSTG